MNIYIYMYIYTSVLMSLYSDVKLVDTGVKYKFATALEVQMKLRAN